MVIGMKKVLIISDIVGTTTRNLLKNLAKLGKFDTLTCTSGNEAKNVLEKYYSDISLILLDVLMPGRSGMEVLRYIKAEARFKHILVVLFTEKSFNEKLTKADKQKSTFGFRIGYRPGDGDDDSSFPYPYIYISPGYDGFDSLQALIKKVGDPKQSLPYCTYCGGILVEGESICHVCGNKVG